MTDRKFTDDDVIETLKNAKYKVDGVVTRGFYLSPETFNAVVDLIGCQKAEIESLKIANEKMYSANKEQEAEIESLQAVHADMTESLRLAAEANKDMQAEIEKLESLSERLGDDVTLKLKYIYELEERLAIAKADTIKEFAQRLVAIYENDKTYDRPNAHTLVVTVFRNIDTLVKEMTEEKTNEFSCEST